MTTGPTIRRTEEESHAIISDPGRDVFVAEYQGQVVGFVVIDTRGPLAGYIQSIWVDPAHRGYGVGSRLMGWAEEFINRVSPNVFVCAPLRAAGIRSRGAA